LGGVVAAITCNDCSLERRHRLFSVEGNSIAHIVGEYFLSKSRGIVNSANKNTSFGVMYENKYPKIRHHNRNGPKHDVEHATTWELFADMLLAAATTAGLCSKSTTTLYISVLPTNCVLRKFHERG
jgi:hypothetical protein